MKLIATVLLFLGASGYALAGVTAVPEIDVVTGAGALTLLGGALLVMRSRRGGR